MAGTARVARKATPPPAGNPAPARAPRKAAAEPPPAEPAQPAEAPAPVEVPFHGRVIAVRMPTPEQLTIFQRLADRFTALAANDGKELTGEQALKHYERALKVVTSVMVNDADVEWLEDQLLAGALDLAACMPLLKIAFEKMADDTNRAERRAGQRGRARLAR